MSWSEFLNNRGRPIHKWTHYFPVYEEVLGRYRNRSCTLLEIGCYKGGSLSLWKKFLGPYAHIVGIDIDPECRQFSEDQITVEIGDQSDLAFLERTCTKWGPIDIVIDDGSHMMSDIQASFDFIYPRIHLDGSYIIEDLHAAYADRYQGGFHCESSFIEFTKRVIDGLHLHYYRSPPSIDEPVRRAASITRSIKIIDSMIVYERGRNIRQHAPLIGSEPPLQNKILETGFCADE